MNMSINNFIEELQNKSVEAYFSPNMFAYMLYKYMKSPRENLKKYDISKTNFFPSKNTRHKFQKKITKNELKSIVNMFFDYIEVSKDNKSTVLSIAKELSKDAKIDVIKEVKSIPILIKNLNNEVKSAKANPNKFGKFIYDYMDGPQAEVKAYDISSRCFAPKNNSHGFGKKINKYELDQLKIMFFDKVNISDMNKEIISDLIDSIKEFAVEAKGVDVNKLLSELKEKALKKEPNANLYSKIMYDFAKISPKNLRNMGVSEAIFIPRKNYKSGFAKEISKDEIKIIQDLFFERVSLDDFKKDTIKILTDNIIKLAKDDVAIELYDKSLSLIDALKAESMKDKPNANLYARIMYDHMGANKDDLDEYNIHNWVMLHTKGSWFKSISRNELAKMQDMLFKKNKNLADGEKDSISELTDSMKDFARFSKDEVEENFDELIDLLEVELNQENPNINKYANILYKFMGSPKSKLEEYGMKESIFRKKKKSSTGYFKQITKDELSNLEILFIENANLSKDKISKIKELNDLAIEYAKEDIYKDSLDLPWQHFRPFKNIAVDNTKHSIAMMFIASWATMKEFEVEEPAEGTMVSSINKDYYFSSKCETFKIKNISGEEHKKLYPKELIEGIFANYPEDEDLNNLLDDIADFAILKDGKDLTSLYQKNSEFEYENVPEILYKYRNISRKNSNDSLMESLISISEGKGYKGLNWKYIQDCENNIRFVSSDETIIGGEVILSTDMEDNMDKIRGRELVKAAIRLAKEHSIKYKHLINEGFDGKNEQNLEISENFERDDRESDYLFHSDDEYNENITSIKVGKVLDVDKSRLEACFYLAYKYMAELEHDDAAVVEAANEAEFYMEILKVIEEVVSEEDLREISMEIYRAELKPIEQKFIMENQRAI